MSRGVSLSLLTRLPAKRLYRFPWADVDRRSRAAREIADIYWRLTTDLGGIEALSTQQLALVERVCFLILRARQHESAVLAGKEPPVDAGTHSNYSNVIGGLLQKLGLDRQARSADDLDAYLKSLPAGDAA